MKGEQSAVMKGVTLKIKSPSALMTDLEVLVELEDTVLQVKEQIAVSYPTRPPTSEQKLVYLGKILRDTDVLEEVLRLEEGVDLHTLHLVCAIPRRQEGGGEVRYRPAPAALAALHEVAVPPPATYTPPSGQDNMEEMMRTFSSQYTAAMTSLPSSPSQEEVAALQELYTQYLGLYMQYLAGQGSTLQYQHLLPAPAPAPAPAGVQEAAQVVQGPADGMVMNAGGGGAVAAEAGGDRNRDILDWVYVMTRVMLLFSVIYFHSSFWRLAFVAGLGFLVFLYQTRQQGRRRQQAPAPAPAPAPPAPVQHEGEEEEEEEEGEEEEGDDTAPLVVEEPKPSGVAVVVTFFTSLISSIIPEQNHVI